MLKTRWKTIAAVLAGVLIAVPAGCATVSPQATRDLCVLACTAVVPIVHAALAEEPIESTGTPGDAGDGGTAAELGQVVEETPAP